MHVGDPKLEDEAAFLTERYCLTDLVDGLKTSCPCGISCNPWMMQSAVQVSCNPWTVCRLDYNNYYIMHVLVM